MSPDMPKQNFSFLVDLVLGIIMDNISFFTFFLYFYIFKSLTSACPLTCRSTGFFLLMELVVELVVRRHLHQKNRLKIMNLKKHFVLIEKLSAPWVAASLGGISLAISLYVSTDP
jgi:hypothetical protein